MRGGEVGGTIATCGAPSGDHRVMVSGETDGAASCHPVTTQPGCVAWSAVSRDTPPSQVSAGSYLLPQSTFIERVNNSSIQCSKYLAVQTKTLKTSRRLPRCLRVVSAGAGEDRATVCDLLT